MNSKRLIWLGLAVLAGLAYVLWWNSPARELRRCHDALLLQKTWHQHAVRNFQGIPPQTDDRDFFCPGFEHETVHFTDAHAAPPSANPSVSITPTTTSLMGAGPKQMAPPT